MDASPSTKKRGRWYVKCLTGALLISYMLFGMWAASDAEEEVVKFQVKSEFLYYLPKFVRWPESTLDDPQKSLTVCVFGHEDMHDYLYRLDDSPMPDHVFNVSFRNIDAGLLNCQMAYIERASRLHARAILEWCHHNHILTISDQPGFIELGGVTGFALIDEQVQLVISRSAAQSSELQISAKLA